MQSEPILLVLLYFHPTLKTPPLKPPPLKTPSSKNAPSKRAPPKKKPPSKNVKKIVKEPTRRGGSEYCRCSFQRTSLLRSWLGKHMIDKCQITYYLCIFKLLVKIRMVVYQIVLLSSLDCFAYWQPTITDDRKVL